MAMDSGSGHASSAAKTSSSALAGIAIAPRPVPETSTPALDSAAPVQPQNSKRKRIACKECRQGKLRCEGSNLQTCTRCMSLGIPCVYDDEYKRYNKRLKLRELTEEVARLRAANETKHTSPLQQDTSPSQHSEGVPTSNGASSSRVDPASPALLTRQPSYNHPPSTYTPREALKPQSLGNTTLSSTQISRLFKKFFSEHHPYIPIVDVSLSPDDCYTHSPLLFWTIIAIASRNDEDDPTMLASLSSSIRILLWQTIGSPPHTRSDLKAMVLICLWPFPTSSMSTDPSYILASVCKSSAMHVGIHKPQFVQDFSRVKFSFHPEELKDALMIWCTCFIAAESTTSSTGQQPLFVTDATLDTVCNSSNSVGMPLDLYHLVLIWRFCNRIHRVMASRERRVGSLGENDSGVLLPLYENELIQLRQQLGEGLSKNNEIIFLHASLQLRCYYFLERHAKAALKEGILKAYSAALSIISKIQDRDTEAQLLRRGPILYQNALSLASTFVLKIQRSSYSQLVDAEEGRKAFNMSLSLMRKCSIEDNDLPGRFSKILAQLWCATPEEASGSPHRGLNVTTRLAGSLLHDTLWKWREKFGGQSPSTQGSQSSPASISRIVGATAPSRPWAITPADASGHGASTSAGVLEHLQHDPSVPTSGDFGNVDIDLINEFNSDWFWNGSGLSSLIATDLDAIEFTGEFDDNFANQDHASIPS